jgi:glycosyltransferase involved in cell wall biosynthesis
MNNISGKNIIIISPENWNHLKVSKHHYASELSKNNTVFFINPPKNHVPKTQRINDNLLVIDYKISKGINRLPSSIRKVFQKKQIRSIKKYLNISNIDIVWSFDPFVFQDLSIFDSKALKIFHPVDVHLTDLDIECAINADLVLSTANAMLDKYRNYNDNCFQINHGLSEHFVNRINDIPLEPDKNETTKPIKVGYVGNLNYSFLDQKTLINIIRSHPPIEFHFIGKNNPSESNRHFITTLEKEFNCFLHGTLTPEEVSVKIQDYDCFLLCYTTDSALPFLANPHKILEYLSTGKMVISHQILEYEKHQDLVEMASDNSILGQKFTQSILNMKELNSVESQKKRIDFAKINTYKNHITKIGQIISKLEITK